MGVCQRDLPLTREHFHRKPTADPPFHTVCKECRSAAKALTKKPPERRLTEVEQRALDIVCGASERGTTIPHTREAVEAAIELVGGVQMLMKLGWVQYFQAAPGSAMRSRWMETCVRLIAKNTEQGGVQKPLTMWTDEELMAEINRRDAEIIDAEVEQRVSTLRIEDGRKNQKSA